MRSLIIIFISLILIHSALAWPLDMRINKAIVKSDDVYRFNVQLINNPSEYPSRMIVDTRFNATQKRERCETCVGGIMVIEEQQPADLDILFNRPINGDSLAIIGTNKLQFDPVNEIAPKDLVAHGSYNKSLGGLPGIVTWWAYTEGEGRYIIINMKMVGLTHDNDTEIAVKSDAAASNNVVSDTTARQEKIAEWLSSFNASLDLIQLHYLA